MWVEGSAVGVGSKVVEEEKEFVNIIIDMEETD